MFVEQGRGLVSFGAGSHGAEVAEDLDGGANDAPWKAPPPERAGEEDGSQLTFHSAGFAGKFRSRAPRSHHEDGPNLVRLVDIDRRTGFLAARAGSVVGGDDHFGDELRIHFVRQINEVARRMAVFVAEFLGTLGNATKDDRSIAVCAAGHDLFGDWKNRKLKGIRGG